METTFAVIKPDAVSSGAHYSILREMNSWLDIVEYVNTTWTEEFAAIFYAQHGGQPFFLDLVRFMSSGPTVSCVLRGENSVTVWRNLIGSTDPRTAKPNTIRARYGSLLGPVMYNAVHGSDSVESAEREITVFGNWYRFGRNP